MWSELQKLPDFSLAEARAEKALELREREVLSACATPADLPLSLVYKSSGQRSVQHMRGSSYVQQS